MFYLVKMSSKYGGCLDIRDAEDELASMLLTDESEALTIPLVMYLESLPSEF